jgi:hypothetical protein
MATPYFQEFTNTIQEPTMDLDDEEMNGYVSGNESNKTDETDIEWELAHLKDFDNEKQLDLLRREIGHIVAHGLQPCEGWYDERFEHINLYSKLGWSQLAQKFHNNDQYLHDTAIYIMRLADELLEERGCKPNFHLGTYHRLIHSVQNVWNYYKQVYSSEDDTDVMNLIESMSSLMK